MVSNAPFVEISYPFFDIHKDFSTSFDDFIEDVKVEKGVIWTISGCVVNIHEHYILLHTPITGIWKILVKMNLIKNSPFIKDGHPIELGYWMKLDVVPRWPLESDLQKPPKYSHIATSEPCYFDIRELMPEWEQRFIDNIYQVKISVVILNNNLKRHEHENYKYYSVASTFQLVVNIPAHRLEGVLSKGTGILHLRFWASRGRLLSGNCMHLFENDNLEQVLSDGSVIVHKSPIKYDYEYKIQPQIQSYIHPIDQKPISQNNEEMNNEIILSPLSIKELNATLISTSEDITVQVPKNDMVPRQSSDRKSTNSTLDALLTLHNPRIQCVIDNLAYLSHYYDIVDSKIDELLKMSSHL